MTDHGSTNKAEINADLCRLVGETARVFILYSTPDGVITHVNPYAEEVGGYTRAEVVGRRLVEVYVTEPDAALVLEHVRMAAAGEPVKCEAPLRTKSGEEIAMIWNLARSADSRGRAMGLAIIGIDVSEINRVTQELSRSEHLYRTLVDHSVAGIFIVQDGRFVFANRRAEEMAGYTLEEIDDRSIFDLVHPDYRAMMADRMARRLAGEPVENHYEYVMIHRSGEPRAIEIWATLIEYHGRDAILATMIDITERKRGEEMRIQADRELERHKSRFYMDTITAVTQGVLEIVEEEDVAAVIRNPLVRTELAEPVDVTSGRYAVRSMALEAGLSGDRLGSFLLSVGEAAANALKHAGSGTLFAGVRDGVIWAAVADCGPGMDTMLLTQAVFRKGFSTKPSLGLGYTFILEGSDHVMLSTSPAGTTVIMEREITVPVDAPAILDFGFRIADRDAF